MKKILFVAVFFLTLFLTNEVKANPPGDFGFFYSSLAPQGTWIELNDGVTVWQPAHVRGDWAPYTKGQWIWTDDGWYWDSYEPFGYITYHYGRWYNDDYYGWIWVPDYDWAPSWVEWRYDDSYIGWAPLPPYAGFSINIGIHFSTDYHTPYNYWHFVNYRHFCDPYVYNYYAAPEYRYRIYERTKYRNDYGYEHGRVYNRGVDINYVRERTGQNIRERQITRTSDPRDFERNNGRSDNKIRTFVASRDELERDRGNVEIKRSDRKSSLQTSRIEVGGRNTTDRNRNNDNRNPVVEKEQPRTSTRDLERVRGNNNPAETRNQADANKRTVEERRNIQAPAAQRNEQKNEVRQPEVRQPQAKQPEVRQPAVRTEVPRREIPQVRTQQVPERRVEPQKRENTAPPAVRQNVPQRRVETQQQQPRRNEAPRVERQSNPNPREHKSDGNDRGDRRQR